MPTTYNVYAIVDSKFPTKVFIQDSSITVKQFPVIGSFTVNDDNTDNLGWIGNHTTYQQIQNILYKFGLYDMQSNIIKKSTDVVIATSINPSNTSLNLSVGQQQNLSFTFTPSNADDNNLTFSNSTAGIVNLFTTGNTAIVTAKATGSTTLTVSNGNINTTVNITVS